MRNFAMALAALALVGWVGQTRAGDKPIPVEIDGLKSVAPEGWKSQEPDPKLGKFRVLQFALPRADRTRKTASSSCSFSAQAEGAEMLRTSSAGKACSPRRPVR